MHVDAVSHYCMAGSEEKTLGEAIISATRVSVT